MFFKTSSGTFQKGSGCVRSINPAAARHASEKGVKLDLTRSANDAFTCPWTVTMKGLAVSCSAFTLRSTLFCCSKACCGKVAKAPLSNACNDWEYISRESKLQAPFSHCSSTAGTPSPCLRKWWPSTSTLLRERSLSTSSFLASGPIQALAEDKEQKAAQRAWRRARPSAPPTDTAWQGAPEPG